MKKLDIFKYDNFQKYLQDLYEFKKANERGFTFRSFSALAGYKSPNFLKIVIQGRKKLSEESIKKFSTAFRLNEKETEFFTALVRFNQASTTDDKKHLAQSLFEFRKFETNHPLILSEFKYLSKWYYVPIREIIKLKGFQEDPAWIAKRISPRIQTLQAAEAVRELKKLGLIGYDSHGKLIQTNAALKIPPDVNSTLIRVYHKEMIAKGSESIEIHKPRHREISATTLTVSDEDFPKIVEKIRKLRKEITAMTDRSMAASKIFQLNFQFFPLTDPEFDLNIGSRKELAVKTTTTKRGTQSIGKRPKK